MSSGIIRLWWLAGAIAGAWLYTDVAGQLDRAYRPFSTDLPAWIFYAFPTGAILGGMTAYAIASHLGENRLGAGRACVVVASTLSFCYFLMFLHTVGLYGFVYAASESGPAFIWSDAVLLYGIFLLITSHSKSSHNDSI